MSAAVPSTKAGIDQAAIDARVKEIRQNAGLDPQPRSADVKRIRENAGLDPKPRPAEVVRIVGAYRPSLLTPAERQSLIPAAVIRVLENYQRASGFKVLPVDLAKELSCKTSR
jgi:hypothetical protein